MIPRTLLPSLIVVIAILAALGFTILIIFLEPHQAWNWVVTIVATFIAAFLAIAAGLWLNTRQKAAADKERDAQLRQALRYEMEETLSALDVADGMTVNLPDGSVKKVVITHLAPVGLEEAYRSGSLESVTGYNLVRLARKMRMYNVKVSHFLGSVHSQSTPLVVHAVDNVEETRIAIIRDCERLLQELRKNKDTNQG